MSLTGKYIHYKLFAKHKKGHGIHSPFVYDLITKVFNNIVQTNETIAIENERLKLLANKNKIYVNDLGAGSKKFKNNERRICDIARTSLKEKKYANLIFNLVKYFQPLSIIEFGTSFGITSSYIARANPDAEIHTYEGCRNISGIAKRTFQNLGLKNIILHTTSFDLALIEIKKNNIKYDMIIIDGNHTSEATIKYFKFFLNYSHENSILLFDDIYWSKEMRKAWELIKNHKNTTLTIDIYSMGLVFLKKSLSKKDFIIKY